MTTRTISLTEFERRVTRFVPKIREAYVRGLKSTALRLQGFVVEEIDNAKPYPAVDRGELRNSVDHHFFDDGATVFVSAPHAGIMEDGARPFTPPLEPLIAWVKRKGFAGKAPRGGGFGAWADSAETIARAIQRKIQREGIAPRHYFAKAWARTVPAILRREVQRELSEMKT